MSSDFLVDGLDLQLPQYVIQAKYTNFLKDPRVIEKLEIERRYWLLKKVPWFWSRKTTYPQLLSRILAGYTQLSRMILMMKSC